MKTVTVDELGRQIQAGVRPRLLDVRSPAEFSRVRADGACLVPLEQLGAATIASACLNTDDPVYVLCHAGSRAATACTKLLSMGVKNPVRVDGGMLAWEKASLPVVRGAGNRISMERQVRIAAGTLVLGGLGLAWFVHPAFVGVSAFVGAGLIFAGITDRCGLAKLLALLPWNR